MPASSNFSKNTSQPIRSRPSSGGSKSIRRMPACPFPSVAFTVAGLPPRSSAHFRMTSWLVVCCASLLCVFEWLEFMWIPSWLALELDVTTSSSAFAERRPAEFVLVDHRSGSNGHCHIHHLLLVLQPGRR